MFKYAALTHAGNVRSHNEDIVACDPERGLWLVADGMGGHAAGEVASQIAKTTILERFAQSGSLFDAIQTAHRAIVDSAQEHTERSGMGSTVIALLVDGSTAEIAWVGDSRAYLWRKGHLSQVSKDHSYLEELIDSGQLDRKAAQNHPKRNVITQVLGFGNPEPSAASVVLREGDWILLCSDGLSDELTDERIGGVLRASTSVQEAASSLLEKVQRQRGKDNVSIIVVEPIETRTLPWSNPRTLWAAGALALIAAAAALAWLSLA
jgi:protein phosphatase